MYEFDKKQTNETGEFILSSGSSVQVPMMKLKAYLRSGILPGKNSKDLDSRLDLNSIHIRTRSRIFLHLHIIEEIS